MEGVGVKLLNEHYDRWMFGGEEVIFDKIGFFNTGYWKGVEGSSIEIAQLNLIETLVGFLTYRDGNILDVACGKGASSKFLTKYFGGGRIVGINSSERQLGICRAVAPECTFKLMDAADLDFDECSFDNILCIDSASHFSTRDKFFEEAYRVLRHGGRLSMSDIVNDGQIFAVSPEELGGNDLPNIESYRDMVSKAGFRYVRVQDTTEFAIDAFLKFMLKRMEAESDRRRCENLLAHMKSVQCALEERPICCMVFAIK